MPTILVANLWAKQLLVGDVIVAVTPTDTRYGLINSFTVQRDEVVHAQDRLARKAAADLAEAERADEMRQAQNMPRSRRQ